MPTNEQNIKIVSYRGLPATTQEGVYGPMHGTRYGEPVTAPLHGGKLYPLADEGSYFIATNPTPGTAIAGIAAADGYDALEALVHLRNTSSTKRIYLDYLLLMPTAAGTNGTNFNVVMTADRGATRWSSGGSTITPVNANLASGETAECVLKFGALVTAAASGDVRILGDYACRTVIKVVGDKYLFTFGDSAKALLGSGSKLEGTEQLALHVACPPVVLGENDQFLVHESSASQTVAAQYRFSMGFWMR